MTAARRIDIAVDAIDAWCAVVVVSTHARRPVRSASFYVRSSTCLDDVKRMHKLTLSKVAIQLHAFGVGRWEWWPA